jgi:N-acetylglucosaminyldiphosphoundecaprenol N-acetyl-beta-D-mannosaminyltransferase
MHDASTVERARAGSAASVDVLGVDFAALSRDETVALVDRAIATRAATWFTFVNVSILAEARKDPGIHALLGAADYRLVDGMGLMYASRMLGRPLPEMVSGPFLLFRLLDHAQEHGYRVYLLGATAEMIERAVTRARERYPRLSICGHRSGFFAADDEQAVGDGIAAARPDIVFVGMGFPRERLFIQRTRDRLAVPVWIDVGGAFTVLAGEHRLAPGLLRAGGLEWLYRAAQEPRRLFPRYLRTIPLVMALLLQTRARQFMRRSS